MPFPLLKLLLLLLSLLILLLLLLYISLSSSFPLTAAPSLFPTSAIISLAQDNSTFFLSRPAAFGPSLPKEGLTNQLFVLPETQLACDDAVSGDDHGRATTPDQHRHHDNNDPLLPPDNIHYEELSTKSSRHTDIDTKISTPPDGSSLHADIETLQETAEMEGKIVLVMRGGCGFYDKVMWCQRRGAVAVIVGDNEAHRPLLTMYARGDTSNVSVPAVFTSYTTAHLLTSLLPKGVLDVHREKYHKGVKDKDGKDKDGKDGEKKPDEIPGDGEGDEPDMSEGLWITLTPTRLSSSPFVDTLLVLVVSPLVTLTVVYTMLLLRSRYRRRRWRAPKSVVDRLPVRTYQTIPSDPPSPLLVPNSPTLQREKNQQQPQQQSSSSSPGSNNNTTTNTESSTSTSSPSTNTPSRGTQTRFLSPRRYFPPSRECVVCLEEYIDGVSRVMSLPCGHEFHVNCITPWLTTRRRTCPICKGDVVRGIGQQQQEEEEEQRRRRTGVWGVVDNVRDRMRGFAENVGGYNWGGSSSDERRPLIGGGRGGSSTTPLVGAGEEGRGLREGSV